MAASRTLDWMQQSLIFMIAAARRERGLAGRRKRKIKLLSLSYSVVPVKPVKDTFIIRNEDSTRA